MKTSIVSFRRFALRNQEHFIYARTVVTFLKNTKIAELKIFLPKMEEILAKIDVLLKPVVSSMKTQDLLSLDERRDRLTRQIRKAIEFAELDDNADTRRAAERLARIFRTYGGDFTGLGYTEQTGRTYNLLTDLAKTDEAAAVEKLGIKTQVAELKKANTAFETLYADRLTEEREKPVGDIRPLRAEFDELTRMLTNYIEILDFAKPAEGLNLIASDLSALNRKNATLIAIRSAYGEAAQGKKLAEITALLSPMIPALAKELKKQDKDVQFGGKTYGSGKERIYLIETNDGERPYWYAIRDGKLVKAADPEKKPKKPGKPSGGASADDVNSWIDGHTPGEGGGSGNSGGGDTDPTPGAGV